MDKELKDTYIILDDASEYLALDTVPIKITVDPYLDVEFRFQKINIKMEEENLNINFNVEILKNPNNVDVELNNQEFIDFLGKILYDMLVYRDDIITKTQAEPEQIDLEDDVHSDSYGKNYS
jgi:hypothetical protein